MAVDLASVGSALGCRGLSVAYGQRKVLHEIDLEFEPGLWTAVVGPNGSGKSTLLRALAGLQSSRGEIFLAGRPLKSWPRRSRARQLAWLAQGAPTTDLTARESVALGRFSDTGWLGSRESVDEAAIEAAMDATGTTEWGHRRLSTLSGGERQRVHLARALATQAKVLLLDEPTTHLDPPHQQDVALLMKRQAREQGVCVVSAIHELSIALAADRLIVVKDGMIIGHGSVNEALSGDWLSAAFGTPIEIVQMQGAFLWCPKL